MFEFYKRCCIKSFSNSLGQIELWTGICTAILVTGCHFLQNGDTIVAITLWRIPIWVLGSVMTIRLILSPYWVWKETSDKLIEVQKINNSNPTTPLEIFEEYLQKQADWLEKYSKCPTKNVQARRMWIENTMKGYETACGQPKAVYFQGLVRHRDISLKGAQIDEGIVAFLKTQKNTITSSEIMEFTQRDLKKFETTINPC